MAVQPLLASEDPPPWIADLRKLLKKRGLITLNKELDELIKSFILEGEKTETNVNIITIIWFISGIISILNLIFFSYYSIINIIICFVISFYLCTTIFNEYKKYIHLVLVESRIVEIGELSVATDDKKTPQEIMEESKKRAYKWKPYTISMYFTANYGIPITWFIIIISIFCYNFFF